MTVFLSIVGGLTALIVLIAFGCRWARKSDMSDWKVGDELMINYWHPVARELNNKGTKTVKLSAWADKKVFVDSKDGYVREFKYGDISCNKSAKWRRLEAECKVSMKNPDFSFHDAQAQAKENKADSFFGDKTPELMNETELNVYLQKAIKEDKYEEAALIRDQLKRFR